ncbi:MAG: helix-turn-helix domain-containing protein [Caulobacterales bacterium]|jgi:AraC-like DNA-binding protein
MPKATHGFQNSPAGGQISLSGARAGYCGPALNLAPHRNVVATIAIALDDPFELALAPGCDSGGPFARKHIALIPPGVLHHLRAKGDMGFIYLDALSDDHRNVKAMALDDASTKLGFGTLKNERAFDVDALCDALGVPKRKAVDPRIAAVVTRINQRPQDFARISDAAALAQLSASRFQALFRQAVGIPFRRYRLWRRMAVVVTCVSAGESLTNAALEAGFAGSAHLSATFKAMFGLSVSGLLASGIQIHVRD